MDNKLKTILWCDVIMGYSSNIFSYIDTTLYPPDLSCSSGFIIGNCMLHHSSNSIISVSELMYEWVIFLYKMLSQSKLQNGSYKVWLNTIYTKNQSCSLLAPTQLFRLKEQQAPKKKTRHNNIPSWNIF